jgi:hypothetical protein
LTNVTIFTHDSQEGSVEPEVLYERLERARLRTVQPFAKDRLELTSRVGSAIIKANVSPSITHFAFWIRATALHNLADSFAARLPPRTHARARGLVFHLPPQNVETIFLYSWILSYLSGNANVVRLPALLSPEMRAVCQLFLVSLEAHGDTSQLFVHYFSHSDISARICARSDARVVWGGTAKIEAFAGVPLRNGGKSIWFGDRFSFSVVAGAAICALGLAARDALAQKLFNDIYIFDQMACSSPHILYVVGKQIECLPAVNALLAALSAVARAKGAQHGTGHVIRKLVEAMSAAAVGDVTSIYWSTNELTSVVAANPNRVETRVGGGYLRICFIDSLDELQSLIREHDQTITYFGFSREIMAQTVAKQEGPGATRIAPVGAALEFDFIWDGYDIPFELTRLVRVD